MELSFSSGKSPLTLLWGNDDFISLTDTDAIEQEFLPIIAGILEENEDVVTKVKQGNKNSMGFLMGQVMKAAKGKAKPDVLKKLLEDSVEKYG